MIKVKMLEGNPQGLKAGTVVRVGVAPAKEMSKKEWAEIVEGKELTEDAKESKKEDSKK